MKNINRDSLFCISQKKGLFIYFGYGINHSLLEQQQQQQTTTDQQTNIGDDNDNGQQIYNGLNQNNLQQQQQTTLELKIPSNRLQQTMVNKNNPFLNPSIELSSFQRNDSIDKKPPIPPRPKNRQQTIVDDNNENQKQKQQTQFQHQQQSSTQWETFD